MTWHRFPWKVDRPVRIVHLTDLHVGPTTPQALLARAAEVVRSLAGDVVVLTGDYVNQSVRYAGRLTGWVASLERPCVAVLGNHDHWADPVAVTHALERGGATVLRNRWTTVRGDGWSLDVVGVDDGRSRQADIPRAFTGVPDAERALVLTHFPNTADAIAATKAPLVLSGHTHAGQVDASRLTRWAARRTGNPYLQGFYRIDRTDLYVNAGLGHSLHGLRGRGAAPEIAVFDLDPRADARSSLRLGAARTLDA